MDMELRVMTPAERSYSYTQSQQIIMQTGCLGHLRADMDASGEGFFSSWDNHRSDLKTQEFKDEFDAIINALRFDKQYGGVLANRSSLAAYCNSHKDSCINPDEGREYGFRADTEKYAYLLRLNPNKGEYNLYCYCYVKERLDHHLQQAERGIRFITPDYKELFKIPDGDRIRITTELGEVHEPVCRYIDDYHLEVGATLFHICEFAERMEESGNTVIPLRSSLPEKCFGTLPSTGELIIIKRGEEGSTPAGASAQGKTGKEAADIANAAMGVTKAQAAAMLSGSMFGWAVPAADPKNYDETGSPLHQNQRERGGAR